MRELQPWPEILKDEWHTNTPANLFGSDESVSQKQMKRRGFTLLKNLREQLNL